MYLIVAIINELNIISTSPASILKEINIIDHFYEYMSYVYLAFRVADCEWGYGYEKIECY